MVISFQNTKTGDIIGMHRDTGDRDVGIRSNVFLNHVAKIHLVQLVARQDEHIFKFVYGQMVKALSYRIGSTLVPAYIGGRLLSRQNINKGLAEIAEMIGVLD